MEHAEYFDSISAYVQKYGIGELNTASVRDRDRVLYNGITKRMGGFKKIKLMILEGTIQIPGYNLSEEIHAEEEPYEDLVPEPEDAFSVVMKSAGYDPEEEVLPVPEKNPTPAKEVPFQESGVIRALKNLTNGQNELMALLGEMNSEIQSLRVERERLRSNEELMHDKLKLIEDSYIDNVRDECVAGIKRYAGLTRGKISGTTIQRAYADMYAIFNEKYDVNLYSIQATLVGDANRTRRQRGDKPIDFIHPSKKGLRPIDIIERLGMIVEFYLIIKQAIEDYCIKNELIASDFEEEKKDHESIRS